MGIKVTRIQFMSEYRRDTSNQFDSFFGGTPKRKPLKPLRFKGPVVAGEGFEPTAFGL